MKTIPLIALALNLVLVTNLALSQNRYQGPVDDNTYLSTVRLSKFITEKITRKIKNKLVSRDTLIPATGTGFFVFRTMPNSTARVFLVTNKHMVGDWSLTDSLIINKSVSVSFYTKSNLFKNININLKDAKGNIASYVHPYPNPVVDVVVIDVTNFLNDILLTDVALFGIPIDNLISLANLGLYNIYTGSQVLITGYPSGVGIASQSRPIVKSAIISSPLTATIDINISTENRTHKISTNNLFGKIILIDGYIVGGNSGGPVFTPRDKITEPNPLGQFNYVIGIVSSVYNNTGVSVLYSSDYIKDLIYMFTNQ